MDSKTEQRLNEMRAKYAALAQEQRAQQGQGHSYGNAAEIGRETQPKHSSGGGFKGFLLGVASVGAAVALWFGGQKHGEAKASVGQGDAAMNSQPTMNKIVDNTGGQKPAGMTMVDLQQGDESQQTGGDVVEQTPTPKNDKPMTLKEQIRMLELARDQRMRECSSQGDLKGVAQAQREFDEACRMLRGQPTKADARAAVEDARVMANAAADISRSGARVAENTRYAADSVGRMQTVDPARRKAEVAGYNASEAGSRHVEAHEQNMTLEERLRVVQHAAEAARADVQAVDGFVRAIKNFGRR